MNKLIRFIGFMFGALLINVNAQAQTTANPIINTEKITIARDSYGVPHIFAPTDPEVA